MTAPPPQSMVIMVNAAYEDAPLDRWLAGGALDLTVLTATRFAEGYRGCGRVVGFDDYPVNENVTLMADDILRSAQSCQLFAYAEVDILRAARLRERHGLRGQRPASAIACRDKLTMKAHVAAAGLSVPVFATARDGLDVADFVAEHGYPVVLKPTDGSGSVDTSIVRTHEDVKRAVRRFPARPMEVERFVEGQMLHIDGLFADGAIVYAYVSRYVNSCLSWMTNEFVGSHALVEGDPLRVRAEAFAGEVIASLPDMGVAAFHLEIFHTPADEFVFCEIASRTGGGLIARALELTSGRHPTRDWVRLLAGLPPVPPLQDERCGGLVQMPPQNGRLVALPDLTDLRGVVEQIAKGAPGQAFNGGEKSGLYLVGCLIADASAEEVEKRIFETAAAYAERVVWQA